MEEYVLNIGLKISDSDNKDWRIIYLDEFRVNLIQMNCSRRHMLILDRSEVDAGLYKGIYSISSNQEIYLVDTLKLPEEARKLFEVKRYFIRDFYGIFGPTFFELSASRSAFLSRVDELSEKYGISKVTSYRTVLRWLQSGLQDSSLVDMRYLSRKEENPREVTVKLGRKSKVAQGVVLNDEILGHFSEALEYYKHNRVASFKDAYVRMILNHYSTIMTDGVVLASADEMPTERQLRYFFDKHLSYKEKKVKETSVSEYRNSNRLLMGSPRNDALRPGWIVEVDALEVDLQIVSSVTNQNVGKPIVYFMVDIYSHGIVAFSVGYENNSNLGLSDLMLNLFEDKTELFKAYGIKESDSIIPSRFIPNEIRCDRGADFKSDYFLRVCKELSVRRSLVTGATGSLKGSVEQSFRQFQKNIRPTLLNLGIVQPRYDSNHYEEAVLTLEDTFKLVISFVAFYNTRSIKGLQLTPHMMHESCAKTPIAIWNYGISEKGGPMPITESNYHNVLYSLLHEDTATISRRGIQYKGLIYSTNTDMDLLEKMRRSKMNANKRTSDGKKINSFDIRVDPRSINSLFYLKEGKLCILDLIPSLNSVRDISWSNYSRYRAYDSELERQGKRDNLRSSVGMAAIVETVASEAVDRSNGLKPVSSEMKKSRMNEKDNKNFANRIVTRIVEENVGMEKVDTVSDFEEIVHPAIDDSTDVLNIETATEPMPQDCPEEIKDLFD